MILYGRDVSPFVRRVAIFCELLGHKIERREILTMGEDFERLRALNPVGRVPVLVLDDGTHLTETFAIGDWLDETAPNGRRMLPAAGIARRDAYQRLAIANATAEKAVALVYEKNRRPEAYHWPDWQARLVTQIRGGLDTIERSVPGDGWSGADGPDAGDIAAVIALQFIEATNPSVLEPGYPRLAALAERAMALPIVAATRPKL